MIREKSHYTFNHWTDSWFLESNGKRVQWDFSLIINRVQWLTPCVQFQCLQIDTDQPENKSFHLSQRNTPLLWGCDTSIDRMWWQGLSSWFETFWGPGRLIHSAYCTSNPVFEFDVFLCGHSKSHYSYTEPVALVLYCGLTPDLHDFDDRGV